MCRGLNAAVRHDFFEFDRSGYVSGEFEHVVHPVWWGVRVGVWHADPVSYLDEVGDLVWVPRYTDCDAFQAASI